MTTRRIDFEDGGFAVVDPRPDRRTLVLAHEDGDGAIATCVILDTVGALELAEELTSMVAESIGEEATSVVVDALRSIAKIDALRPTQGPPPCRTCDGMGRIVSASGEVTCPQCNGEGRARACQL